MSTKNIRHDDLTEDPSEEAVAARKLRARSIAESRGDQGTPSATRQVDPDDVSNRKAASGETPEDLAIARMRAQSQGAWAQGGSSGRTKEQAMAAMARDREAAPAGTLTRNARTTDSAADLDDELAAARALRARTEQESK